MKARRSALAAVSRFVTDKAFYSDNAVETDSAKILDRVKFIERVIHDAVVVLCGRERVAYVSSNCMNIIGISHARLKSFTLEQTIDLLHDADVAGFKSCIEKLISTAGSKHDQYKFLLHYRLKNDHGELVSIQDEKMAIETTPGKYVFITLLRNVSKKELFGGLKLTIQKIFKGKFVTIDEFFPNASTRTLTPRQTDIVNLVALGFSNKAIAAKLNLSLSTVKNHKQALFKKISVKSSIELLSSMPYLGSSAS